MAFFDTQNPGIGGLDEITDAEALLLQNLASLSDPNADRILFWDDSAGAYAYLTVGSGLSITGTTLSATGGGTIDGSGTTNEIAYWVDSDTLGALAVATYPSLTELAYVKGVTSAIQTQLNAKTAGAASSTDNAVARFDGAGGKTIQNSGVIIDDSDNVTGVTTLNIDGTGNSLVVDTDTFVVDATNNKVMFGASDSSSNLTAFTRVQFTDADGNNADWSFKVAANGYGVMNFGSSGGTTGTPSVVSNNGILGSIEFYGHDGTNFETAAAIRSFVNGTPGNNDMPGALRFLVTPDGSATLGTAVEILQDKSLKLYGQLNLNGQTVLNTGTVTFPTATTTLVGRDTTDTLSNKTLTAPRFADGGLIADNNGNEQVVFNTTASATTYVDITNAATGTTGPLVKAAGETNVDIRIGGNGTGKVAMQSSVNFGAKTAYFTETDNGNSSTSDTIDWTVSNKQKSTLTGNCTFTFTAPPGPCNLILKLVQDATGSRTVTWPAAVKWSGGVAPTLTTTASRIDIISFYYDGTNYYGTYALNFTA